MIDYDQNIDLIEKVIDNEQPQIALENMVLSLSKKGESKKNIYDFLFNYYTSLGFACN